jgi:hypothetical protein
MVLDDDDAFLLFIGAYSALKLSSFLLCGKEAVSFGFSDKEGGN